LIFSALLYLFFHFFQAQKLIAAVFPLASINIKVALEIVSYHTGRNFVVYQSHRKRNPIKAEKLLSDVSM